MGFLAQPKSVDPPRFPSFQCRARLSRRLYFFVPLEALADLWRLSPAAAAVAAAAADVAADAADAASRDEEI